MESAFRHWRDGLAAGLGLLMVSGVYVDGWAHLNRPSRACASSSSTFSGYGSCLRAPTAR
jgi:hypothetical protein